ncbi:hypothetical protein BCR44DRAFT_23083 [Catenaria anguillulae PL171]|uniref:UBA domain-containing protein n=1 Tax=Catenaria anguillulae PL171 TaxID=765915 RepID=A0A1Y2HWR0_9FUNG|nr:hypothetical protein BCR44DRAFT_23083 [Catenaria anguillulae PL171]
MTAKDAAAVPLPPSPLPSLTTPSPYPLDHSTATKKHLPVTTALPGGLPVSLSFTAFGSRYSMDTVLTEGAKIASQIAALVQRHAIPAHIEPLLVNDAAEAVRTVYDEIGCSTSSPMLAMPPPPDFDFAHRIDHLVSLYSVAAHSSSTSSPFDTSISTTADTRDPSDIGVAAAGTTTDTNTRDLEEAFSLAYRRVVHAPISGLLDAVLGLQVRYAAALQQLSGKRNADLVRLAQMHEKERRTDPGLAASHESERREALAMWQAQMADMAEEQRDEFRFFIQAIAHVLAHHPEDQPPLDYQALMHRVFDMDRDVPPLAAPAALPAGSPTGEDPGFVRGRAASFNGSPSVGVLDSRGEDHASSGGAETPPAVRRTLRKSASTQLLRLTNLHSDTDSSDDDGGDDKDAKGSIVAPATDNSTSLESPPMSPTLTVSPVAPSGPDQNDALSSQNDMLAARIMEMGFNSDEAHAALLMADNQVEQALSLLLENPASVTDFIKQQKAERERIATAKASKSSVQRKLTERLASQLPTLSSGGNPDASTSSSSSSSRVQPVPASTRRKVSTPDHSASGATNSTSPSWSPLRFLQTEVGGAVQGKLSGWFSGSGTGSPQAGGAARSTSPPGRSSSIHSLPGSTHSAQSASSSTAVGSAGQGHGHGIPHPTPAGLLALPTASPTSLTTESFSVYLGTQLKVTYVVTLVRVPPVSMGGGLASYLVPPTPPAGVSKQSDPGAWGEAVAVRSRMAIDLYRALHVLVVPYPAGTTPRAVANRSVVAQVATGMVPELVFEDVKKQVKHAAAAAGVEYGSGSKDRSRTGSAAVAADDGWVDVDTTSTDAMGTVLFTRHSNLACCNAIAHVFPTGPSSAGDVAASSTSSQADMSLLKALISQLRPSDPVEFSLPVSFAPDTLVDALPTPTAAADLTGSALSRRIETVIKGMRGSLLDRARVRVFGAPDPERQGSGMSNRSVSALGVPTEGDGTLDGGTVALLCMSDDEWRIAHRVVASVFKTG